MATIKICDKCSEKSEGQLELFQGTSLDGSGHYSSDYLYLDICGKCCFKFLQMLSKSSDNYDNPIFNELTKYVKNT